jgi:hypothetical protein
MGITGKLCLKIEIQAESYDQNQTNQHQTGKQTQIEGLECCH